MGVTSAYTALVFYNYDDRSFCASLIQWLLTSKNKGNSTKTGTEMFLLWIVVCSACLACACILKIECVVCQNGVCHMPKGTLSFP